MAELKESSKEFSDYVFNYIKELGGTGYVLLIKGDEETSLLVRDLYARDLMAFSRILLDEVMQHHSKVGDAEGAKYE